MVASYVQSHLAQLLQKVFPCFLTESVKCVGNQDNVQRYPDPENRE